MTASAVCIADSVREKKKTANRSPPLHILVILRRSMPRFYVWVLRSLTPACEILFLLCRELVDLHTHGLEFQLCDFLVEINRHWIDLLLQRAVVLHDVFDGERLV